MGIRSKRRFITLVYVVVSTALILMIAPFYGEDGKCFFAILLFGNFILARRIGWALHKAFIAVAECSHCGCGYVSTRHAFDKCSNCDGRFGYIPCPKCEVAVDI